MAPVVFRSFFSLSPSSAAPAFTRESKHLAVGQTCFSVLSTILKMGLIFAPDGVFNSYVLRSRSQAG